MPLGRLGKYERVDVLGHGISGIVYLAWDTMLKKQVALKEIDIHAADIERFLEEARVMDRLSHPNIARVNGVDRIEGRIVIDMEYVRGENLQDILRREGKLSLDRALKYAIQTLDALAYAHSMRTVHRDIKPANLLITRDEQIKLVDFGLARILSTNSFAGGAGTYAYMAPEDFAEERQSDHRSDIWAVGIILYEMVTGQRPFEVENVRDPFAWRRALLNENPHPLSDSLPDTPAGLQAVLDHALAQDKDHRYGSAEDFEDDLKAILHGEIPTVPLSKAVTPIVTETIPLTYKQTKRRSIFRKKQEIPPTRIYTKQQQISFGDIRLGERRKESLQLAFEGGNMRPCGEIQSIPDWVDAQPVSFSGKRPLIQLTARTDRLFQIGAMNDILRISSNAGDLTVPITVKIIKARPAFAQIAGWYIPLILIVLLPVLCIVGALQTVDVRYLLPSAALGTGLLCSMLLLVGLEAELGPIECAAPVLIMVVMSVLLGASLQTNVSLRAEAWNALPATGVPLALALVAHSSSRRHWKAWAFGILLLSLLTSGCFLYAMNG